MYIGNYIMNTKEIHDIIISLEKHMPPTVTLKEVEHRILV